MARSTQGAHRRQQSAPGASAGPAVLLQALRAALAQGPAHQICFLRCVVGSGMQTSLRTSSGTVWTPTRPFSLSSWFQRWLQGFTGGPVVKSLPANARDMHSIPGLGGSQCLWATKPMCHNYWDQALELKLPEHPRACAPPPEKPPQWEAHCTKMKTWGWRQMPPTTPGEKQLEIHCPLTKTPRQE